MQYDLIHLHSSHQYIPTTWNQPWTSASASGNRWVKFFSQTWWDHHGAAGGWAIHPKFMLSEKNGLHLPTKSLKHQHPCDSGHSATWNLSNIAYIACSTKVKTRVSSFFLAALTRIPRAPAVLAHQVLRREEVVEILLMAMPEGLNCTIVGRF